MRPAPSLSRFFEFPVTGAICAMAIFVTFAVQTGRTDIDPFVMSSLAFESEPWRLASSALPHGNWFHLLFNIIWVWVLGTKLEETFGAVATFAIMLVLAVGSEAAEFAFAAGGIGLSGVGYGLVGLLWILRKRDPRFRDAIDRNVLITFIAWGVLCVLLTLSNVWAIGNIAHGGGFAIGLVLGLAIAPAPSVHRTSGAIASVVLVGGLVFAAGWLRPHVNLSGRVADDDSYIASRALDARQWDRAARHLRRALALDASDATDWYNYGVALQYVTDPSGLTALDAWNKALALSPDDARFRDVVAHEYLRQGIDAQARGDLPRAAELYTASIAVKETAEARWNLGTVYDSQGRDADAERELARAEVLDPAIGQLAPATPDGSAK